MRQPPLQKPGRSRQDFSTPDDFIAAVKHRLEISEFVVDLAADASNAKALRFLDKEHDSLAYDWERYRNTSGGSWCWLNPPFEQNEAFARKCAESQWLQVALLVPGGQPDWFRDYVDGRAYVLMLNGRLSFDGNGPYPKDCSLCLYGMTPGYELWDWRKDVPIWTPDTTSLSS